jgi:hypothetical protein
MRDHDLRRRATPNDWSDSWSLGPHRFIGVTASRLATRARRSRILELSAPRVSGTARLFQDQYIGHDEPQRASWHDDDRTEECPYDHVENGGRAGWT